MGGGEGEQNARFDAVTRCQYESRGSVAGRVLAEPNCVDECGNFRVRANSV